MARGDHSLAISMTASLAVHAAIAVALVRQQNVALPHPSPRPQVASIFLPDRAEPTETFGVADGTGDAPNASPGESPMLGMHAEQMQAFLSRDPVGPGRVGDDPSMNVLPRSAPTEMAGGVFGMPSRADVTPARPTVAGRDQTSLTRTKSTPVAAEAPGGATASAQSTAADPAIMSDSESDPFSRTMSVEIRDGRVEPRLGRKVKTVRPKLNLAARFDLMASESPRMLVRLNIDPQGAVRKVDILRSSGSASADQAVKVALYQWWVEPKTDPAGAAMASSLTFPITWH